MNLGIVQVADGWAVVETVRGRWGRTYLRTISEFDYLKQATDALLGMLNDEDEDNCGEEPEDNPKPKGLNGKAGEAWELAVGMVGELDKRTKDRDALLKIIESTIVKLTKDFADYAKRPPQGQEVRVELKPKDSVKVEAPPPPPPPAKVEAKPKDGKEETLKERFERMKAERKAKEAKASPEKKVLPLP